LGRLRGGLEVPSGSANLINCKFIKRLLVDLGCDSAGYRNLE